MRPSRLMSMCKNQEHSAAQMQKNMRALRRLISDDALMRTIMNERVDGLAVVSAFGFRHSLGLRMLLRNLGSIHLNSHHLFQSIGRKAGILRPVRKPLFLCCARTDFLVCKLRVHLRREGPERRKPCK